MSKLSTIMGVLRTLWSGVVEDWQEMDHKLMRIVFGAVSFAVAALFWFYFLRHITPF
jgi:hypothetical protein